MTKFRFIDMCFLFCILEEGGNKRKGIVASAGYCNGINNPLPPLAQICKTWNAFVQEISSFIFVEKRKCAMKPNKGCFGKH